MTASRWLLPTIDSSAAVTEVVCRPLFGTKPGRGWWIAVLVSFVLTLGGAVGVALTLLRGIGEWGNNTSVVWGFGIANYVWWIGIGNAGTLISSLLLLTRQKWRASINRFAEAMTIVAVSIAGIFPIIHLGRPMYFYFLAPYLSTTELWPQWRSALVWDFWAIISYLLFSILFFYIGLIPDLATLRERATSRGWQRIYGAMALGWQGSPQQWAAHEAVHKAMAVIAVPLVCSVHSIVGMDFAASLMPGWTESIFPPYFVVGALFSGFAMVVLLALAMRRFMRLEALIRPAHFDAMGKVMLASACIMGISYATEWVGALWTGDPDDLHQTAYALAGHYAPFEWAMLFGNVALPQAFWSKRLRRNPIALIAVSIGILIGMWLERILIITNTLSIGYLPSLFKTYTPTLIDGLILAGTLGLFSLAMLLFARLLPVVSMYEVRELVEEARS